MFMKKMMMKMIHSRKKGKGLVLILMRKMKRKKAKNGTHPKELAIIFLIKTSL